MPCKEDFWYIRKVLEQLAIAFHGIDVLILPYLLNLLKLLDKEGLH